MEANVGIICASLVCMKPLIVKIMPNMLLSQAPSRRNLHLPRIPPNGTQNSDLWTCSTVVDGGRRDTGSGSDAQPTAHGINVRFSTTQTSEVNDSQDTDIGLDASQAAAAWTKSWEDEDNMKELHKVNEGDG